MNAQTPSQNLGRLSSSTSFDLSALTSSDLANLLHPCPPPPPRPASVPFPRRCPGLPCVPSARLYRFSPPICAHLRRFARRKLVETSSPSSAAIREVAPSLSSKAPPAASAAQVLLETSDGTWRPPQRRARARSIPSSPPPASALSLARPRSQTPDMTKNRHGDDPRAHSPAVSFTPSPMAPP